MSGLYWKLMLSLIVGINQFSYSNSFAIVDVLEVLRMGYETVHDVLETYEMIRPGSPNDEGSFPYVKSSEKELKRRINRVSMKIEKYQVQLLSHVDTVVAKILAELPLQQRLDHDIRKFDEYTGKIDDLYNTFGTYASKTSDYDKFTMEDFAKTCVSSRSGALPDILKSIHRLLVPHDQVFNSSLLISMANQMTEASSQICNELQSPQQLLYNLYTTVALTEIKGYSMIQFSYVLLRMYNPGSNFSEEMKLVQQQYATRTYDTLRAVKTAMAFAPRDLWRCDPRVHKLDETYTELKQLFQGYVINEVDMNSESTCRENCAYYGYSKVYGCYQNQFCSQQRRCNGKLINCEYIDSDMWICPSAKNSDRRYEYLEYENGRVFGKKDTCSKGTTKVDSWWRWLFWHCSYCFCYCDDHNSSSDRYFSLRSVKANVSKNNVITGLRFKKVKQIIHIQIQEGELLPNGRINETTIAWKPIDAFSILDSNVKNGVDYHTLAWERRALDLDDLVPVQDHLLTGIKFRTVGTRLNLEIMATPFNFTSGKLIQPLEKSFWHSNDITDRSELELKNPDVPLRTSLPTVPDSGINQYLNFAASDREKDAAQSTVPFIDIQPVEPKPPVPISGAGVFHKGRTGSGGFIALKLITYNFAPHLQVDLPAARPVIDTKNNIKTI